MTNFIYSDSQNTNKPKKVLIFGGTGISGNTIAKHFFNCGYDVTITVRKKIPRWIPNSRPISVVYFDFPYSALPDLTPYDFIVNCITDNAMPENPKSAYSVNGILPLKIQMAKLPSTKFFNISTTLVFSGLRKTPYEVNSGTDGDSIFGSSKACGESAGITIRCNVIGYSEREDHGLLNIFLYNKGEKITIRNDNWNGVTALFLAEFIEGYCQYQEPENAPKTLMVHLGCPPLSLENVYKAIANSYSSEDKFEIIVNDEAPLNFELCPNVAFAPPLEEQLDNQQEWLRFNDL